MLSNGGLKKLLFRIVRWNGANRVLRSGGPRLQELGQELNRLNAGTEQEFLTIGEQLQDFSGRAKEISEVSAGTAGIIGGVELNNAIDKLNQIFQQTKLLEGECEKGTDTLSDILQILDTVRSSTAEFLKITKTLVVLGTFMRVESVRLDSMGADFSALANEISQMSKDIEDKCSNISTKAESLSSLLNINLSNVLKVKTSQKDQIRVVINNTMETINSLIQKHNISSAFTNNISESYYDISKKVSAIVMSLQIHDITRQQIEHVEKALCDILPLFQDKSHKSRHLQKSIIVANNICKIQDAQLVIARDKLTQAVCSIIDNLKSIARDIKAISQQVQELVGDASREGNSFLEEIKEHLAAMAAGLKLYGAARQDLLGLMQSIAPAVGEMAKFLLDIERIEIAIERLALNACIKAAHFREEGYSLGVLAEATQNLVGETRQQTQVLAAHLKSINGAAHRLSAGQGPGDSQMEVEVNALVANLGEVLQTLSSLNENIISSLTQVDRQGKSLSADLARASGEITVHEYAGKVLDQVIAGIHELEGQFQTHIPGNYESAGLDDEELAGIKAQYTMFDERKAHDQILISPSTMENEGDLKSDLNNGRDIVDNEQDNTAILGDNIELF